MTVLRVQGAVNSSAPAGAGSSVIACTFSSPVSSKNSVTGAVTWGPTGGETLLQVADNLGNVYKLGSQFTDTTNVQALQHYWLTNLSNAPQTVTASFSAEPPFRAIIADEFSGTSTGSSDESDGTTGLFQSAPSTATDAITSSSITTSTNGDLIYAVTINSAAATLATVGTGFSSATSDTTTVTIQSEYLTQASAGSIAGTFTQGSTNNAHVTTVVALKALLTSTSSGAAPVLEFIHPGIYVTRKVTAIAY